MLVITIALLAFSVGYAAAQDCPIPAMPSCPLNYYIVPNETKDDKGCITGFDCISMGCPEISQPATDFCPNGHVTGTYDAKSCLTGYDCATLPDMCSKPPQRFSCPENMYLMEKSDTRGCITGYMCVQNIYLRMSCGLMRAPYDCPSGQYISYKYDDHGCRSGYDCVPSVCGNKICEPGEETFCSPCTTEPCPPAQCSTKCLEDCGIVCPRGMYQPLCGTDGKTYSSNCEATKAGTEVAYYGMCTAKTDVCGNMKCDAGETHDTCPADCIPTAGCPVSVACSDGSSAFCKQTEAGCQCDQCPLQSVPPGCVQEKDDKGFLRVICKQVCQPVLQGAFDKCKQANGNTVVKKDAAGCEYLDCQFSEPVTNPLAGAPSCPSPEAIEKALMSCEQSGMHGAVTFEGGCKVSKCVDAEKKCPAISEEERTRIFENCRAEGKEVFKDFDKNGCPIPKCGTEITCSKEPPQELFQKCGERGGQVIIRRDENACIVFADCVQRGDVRDAFVENVESVPDTSQILKLVFKLEGLRIEFDKFAKDTNNIADYYKSTNSKDEERYRRAASMFQAARDKTDEIRAKLKDRLNNLSKDDLTEIRYDIRYIKEVVLKDILYVMLSESKELSGIETGSEKDCGTDSSCFDQAFRLCAPAKYMPEGSRGGIIKIIGLEDDRCVFKIILPEDQGPPAGAIQGVNPPYELLCKLPNYAFGVRPMAIAAFCEGPVIEYMKQTEGNASAARQSFPPPEGGPGSCKSTLECLDYCIDNYEPCVKWFKEHPAYGQPPTMEQLENARDSYQGGTAAAGAESKAAVQRPEPIQPPVPIAEAGT